MARNLRNHFDKPYKILPDNNDINEYPDLKPSTSTPVHVQRAERALDLTHFLQTFNDDYAISSDSDDETGQQTPNIVDVTIEGLLGETDSASGKEFYNFQSVSGARKWLADVLEDNSDNVPEDAQYKSITRLFKYEKKLRSSKENFNNSMYYGAGLVSATDLYPEIEQNLPRGQKRKFKDDINKSPLYSQDILDDISNEPNLELNLDTPMDFQQIEEDDSNVNADLTPTIISTVMPSVNNHQGPPRKKAKKFKDEEARKKWEDMMTLKRHKVFTNLVKKEIGKQHRAKMNRHKEMLMLCKRAGQQCAKQGRANGLISARTVKEQPWRMKRLSRENTAYWKRSRRFDREVKKRLEKEAEEQRKIDHELIEAKRQQRKLNFLITQTELYAHFMSRKLGQASPEEQLRILSQLDEERNSKLAIDDYDCEIMKEKAKKNAQEAFQNEKARTRYFDEQANSCIVGDVDSIDGEHPQPNIFRGKLKGYQLRGMNWLANLYSQGISGILADEMGLGKTVQSIAFLCHIAEKYSVWGPFLIISPASTLHNWQQEIAKFVPDFKVVPYWGNPNERKILRQFWDQKDIYTKDASFHIVITSYQIVITDIKYFNRIKWSYMILDEAQAIKSTSSMRWKTLLGFSCRNRLLLSGTPIQNSMAELWALLHFIMPTLFDSHEEFNEWFSKDIESHAENKTGIDEKHLSRLHMILKPFMLRRIKKDVENELSDKIEVMVYCPLTTRQNLLYLALKQKIKIEDLLHYTVGGGDSHAVDKNFTSNLMNLVMQFRKVCNHPELFERRDAKSPITFTHCIYTVPYLLYDYNLRKELILKLQKYFLFTPENILYTIKNDSEYTLFRFLNISLKMSFGEISNIFCGDVLTRWRHYYCEENEDYILHHKKQWDKDLYSNASLKLRNEFKLNASQIETSNVFSELIFTKYNTGSTIYYTHTDHYYYSMQETVEHRNIRLKNISDAETIIDVVTDEKSHINTDFPYVERAPQKFSCEKTELPLFLFNTMPKVSVAPISLYCYSRRAAYDYSRFVEDYSYDRLNKYWSDSTGNEPHYDSAKYIYPKIHSAIDVIRPINGWSNITIPDKETLVTDSGKLFVLDGLLKRLKEEGHRVLIYSQMTKMIDLLEEYMWHRHHKYMRLDGSSKISERRDMVADFQARTDIFVFLLSTRAGGLGINLTAADTVIFYDSDWNPTVDQQAMDRAHRLGQTKQVTVYRLICKGSIEERILQRAREKSEIQKLVISGGNFKPDTLKPKEVVSLLLDDEELVQKYHLKVEGSCKSNDENKEIDKKRKTLPYKTIPAASETKKIKIEEPVEEPITTVDSGPTSPYSANSPETVNEENSDIIEKEDGDSPITNKYTVYNVFGSTVKPRPGRGTSRRGRPRGSRSRMSTPRYPTTLSSASSSTSNDAIIVDVVRTTPSPAPSHGTSPVSVISTPGTSSTYLDTVVGTNISTITTASTTSVIIRRGPGRPRLKPTGPSNAGSRGTYRPRKPARPLPVPLPSDSSNSNSTQNPNYSFYDFPEQFES